MAFYGSEELARKLVQKEIEVKRDFVNKAEDLCGIVKKFDGKVFNKRLETALKEVYYVRAEYDKTFGWLDITGYVQDRMVQSDSTDKWGYRDTAYIKDDKVYVVSCAKDALDADGRIIADNICEKIRQCAEYERNSADALENQLARIDEIKAECIRINNERDAFRRNTGAVIREYFRLEV